MPEFIDIHSHVNFSAFDDDREEVIKRALDAGVYMINVGTQLDTSKSALALAEKYERGVYAIVGLHPVHTDKSYHDENELGTDERGKAFAEHGEVFDKEEYRKLLMNPKVVGIGECGLDFFRIENNESRIKQEEVFKKQIELAIEMDKPIMLHIRSGENNNTYTRAFEILNSYFLIHNSRLRGDVHFFVGTYEDAKPFLDMGFTFSFTGVITFARDYDEVIRQIPIESIMCETDCPYVTPAPYRGKRNEPVYVQEVVKKIAEIKGLELEATKKQIVSNAKRVFRFS